MAAWTSNVLRLNLHLGLGWEHLNFLGGTRHLSISDYARHRSVSDALPDGSTPLKPTRVLLENSLQLKFKQPSFIESRTAGTIDASYNIMPVLYPLPENTDPSAERILGYQTISTAFGLERQFFLSSSKSWPTVLTLATSYNWQANFPFTYQLDVPAGLTQVRVAFPALVTTLDVRDDPVQPHRGPVPDEHAAGRRQSVRRQRLGRENSAGNAQLLPDHEEVGHARDAPDDGLSDPQGLRQHAEDRNRGGSRCAPQSGRSGRDFRPAKAAPARLLLRRRQLQPRLPAARRGSARPGRLLGAHRCRLLTKPRPTNADDCIRPLGGFTLWEASLEVRFPLSGALGAVVFADASDVSREVGHIRLNVPHLSVGPGLRYLTPVGPFRLDIGYRVPGMQAIGEKNLSTDEGGGDVDNLFGISWLPVAVNIALGEAF